jgi:hypothetical protein
MTKSKTLAFATFAILLVLSIVAIGATNSGIQSIDRKASHVRIDGTGEIRVEPRDDKSVTFTVATKSARFDLASIAAAATRTVTFPNANTKLPVMAQVFTFAGPTAARTFTFPDASTTICGTNAVCTGYQAALTNPVVGGGSGYKITRGVAAITGSGDVVTGLTTVVSVIVSPQSDLDGTTLSGASGTIGDQAGAPAAGSITIKTYKITAADNGALIPATAPKNVNWIAIGT